MKTGGRRVRLGEVARFDGERGTGTVRDAATGDELPFHCTAITDGTRTIATGTAVAFAVAAGQLGVREAVEVTPLG